MEVEFDKEMDALLRKAAGSGFVTSEASQAHLDADAIAAFAENAVPQKSREIYTRHLAECDGCRKTLSSLIVLNSEAEPDMASVAAPVAAASMPWYKKLFTSPNLAYTMGALVLVFGGMLGFLVLQNSHSENAAVSQVQETPMSAPAFRSSEDQAFAANATSNANSTSNASGEIPRSVGTADTVDGGDAAVSQPSDTATAPVGNVSVAAPPPPLTTDAVTSTAGQPAPKEAAKSADEEKAAEVRQKTAELELAKREADAKAVREQQLLQMAPGAANNKDAGPNRATLQRDNRVFDDTDAAKAKKMDAPSTAGRSEATTVVRNAGGKKFEQRQGVWYDTAFRGQSTKRIRRGTSEYRDLDGGLRSIAESIGGTVVVVWNGRAYRIQ